MKSLSLAAAIFGAAVHLASSAFAETVEFDDERWQFRGENHRIETFKGKKALFLDGDGAMLLDEDFQDGIIEYDVAVGNKRAFVKFGFRHVDSANFEDFYLRPVQSGRPDANQYTPVFGGLSGWQLYHSPEYAAPTEYTFDDWMHVRLVIKGTRMDVYIDSDEPVLKVPFLKREPVPGGFSFSVGGEAPARYANFRFEKMDSPPITDMEIAPEQPVPGLITDWQVSNEFDEKTLDGKNDLHSETLDALHWRDAEVERGGFVNLARYASISEGRNTVYVRTSLESASAGPGRIDFGYSDRIRVYVNGQLFYSGDNGYRTRDFRYLGTIGLFDSIHAPLKAGKNEIVFAVSESFGGWGIMARLPENGM